MCIDNMHSSSLFNVSLLKVREYISITQGEYKHQVWRIILDDEENDDYGAISTKCVCISAYICCYYQTVFL